MAGTTIYTARRVITMDEGSPFADAVAVRGDRILGVGSVEDLAGWGDHTVDDRFADHVLTSGFVEAHTHVLAGGMWRFPYVGYFDRPDPSGEVWPGCRDIGDVVARLVDAEAAMADPSEPLVAWGLDPIYFDGERLRARHLDRVSPSRPIFVFHASAHLATVNSAMLAASGIDEHTTTPGVSRGPDGKPDGELQEPPAMILAGSGFRAIGHAVQAEEAKWRYAEEARNAGLTVVTDLGTTPLHDPAALAAWRSVTDDPAYPVRVAVAVSAGFGAPVDPAELAALGVELRGESSDKLRFGIVKLVLDGSIQGFTARLSWPYYFDPPEGHPGNGQWLIPPDQMADLVIIYHRAGLTVHCHCNGDQAAEVFIDAVEAAVERHPRFDHRHTVQHSQLTTPAQYRRMAALGMCANIFSNHLYYWGDQHRDITVGPDRAARMDACATAPARRRAALHPLRCAHHPDGPPPHRVVRGEPPDRLRSGAGARRAHLGPRRAAGDHVGRSPPAQARPRAGQHRGRQAGRLRRARGRPAGGPSRGAQRRRRVGHRPRRRALRGRRTPLSVR